MSGALGRFLRKGSEGSVIFSGTNEEFAQSEDPYIQKFISGTEMEPVQTG